MKTNALNMASQANGKADARAAIVGGILRTTTSRHAVIDPDSDELVAYVHLAGLGEVDDALAAASSALRIPWPERDRAEALHNAADAVARQQTHLASLIAAEGIKTIREARAEVHRAETTLRLSSSAALTSLRTTGTSSPPGRPGWGAVIRREPVGIIAAITPFNDPLNLVAHKVGPALAAGNAIIIKPDLRTPLSALALAHLLEEAGVPRGRVSVLPATNEHAEFLVRDPRVRFVSFTGGRSVGRRICEIKRNGRVSLELGGICPTVVLGDADLDVAVPQLVDGAFAAAGQNCLHVQKVLIDASLYSDARQLLIQTTEQVVVGPKVRETSEVGPLIDGAAMRRVKGVVDEAVAEGAVVLTGGASDGPRYLPTLVENVQPRSSLATDEIFGPVTELVPISGLDHAIAICNELGGGIHAGIFTSRRDLAVQFAESLDFGGVVIGGTSDHRSDALPFGGTGEAGSGREGVEYAAAEMTELKTILKAP